MGDPFGDRRERAAVYICLGMVGATCTALVLTAILAAAGRVTGDHFPGSVVMAVMGDDQLVASTKWLVAILGVGSALLARDKTRDSVFWGLVAASFVGAIVSIGLLIAMKSSYFVHRMCDLTDIAALTDPDVYRRQINWLFGGSAAWLGGVLAAQLGIKLT